MTARPPSGLPPLPAARVPVPPDGFERAVRAAGRRRWRSLGGGAGVVATGLAALLTLPASPAANSGLRPAAPWPVGPDGSRAPVATAEPTAVTSPEPVAVAGGTPRAATGPTSPGGAPAAQDAPAVSAAHPSAPSPAADPARRGVPWSRGREPADPERQARCLTSGADDTSEAGSRYGDWCLTVTAGPTDPGKLVFRFAACALSPNAAHLAFRDGRELDFVVTENDRHVWSSATGRTFSAEPGMVKADYPMCTVWTVLWNARGDDGRPVPGGTYDLAARLRLTSASPRHRTTVTV